MLDRLELVTILNNNVCSYATCHGNNVCSYATCQGNASVAKQALSFRAYCMYISSMEYFENLGIKIN